MDSRAILSIYWRSEVSNWSHNTYPVSVFPPNFKKIPASHLWILCMAHGNYSLFFVLSSWISILEIMCCNLRLSTYTAVCSTYLIPELESSSCTYVHTYVCASFFQFWYVNLSTYYMYYETRIWDVCLCGTNVQKEFKWFSKFKPYVRIM